MKKKLLLALAAGLLGFVMPKTANAAVWDVCGTVFYAPGLGDYLGAYSGETAWEYFLQDVMDYAEMYCDFDEPVIEEEPF